MVMVLKAKRYKIVRSSIEASHDRVGVPEQRQKEVTVDNTQTLG